MDPISESTENSSDKNDRRLSEISLSIYEEKPAQNVWPQIIGTIITHFGHIPFGISLSYSAILLPQLNEDDNFKTTSESSKSWLASVLVLVTPISSFLSGYSMHYFGRLNTLRLGTIPALIGWMSIALAWNFNMILIGRVFTGLAISLLTNPAVVYVTEITRKDIRGSLLSSSTVFVSLGILLSYFKGWLMHWQTVAWTCNIYIIVLLILLFFIRESPVWLVSKRRYKEAKQSLEWLHNYETQPNERDKSFAELQLKILIKEQEKKSSIQSGTWRDFFKPTGYKPMLIIIGLFLVQQYSGLYIFLFYTVSFFKEIGISLDPYVAAIFIGLIRLSMSLVATWLFKKFGRRTLAMVSASGMAICTAVSALFTYMIKHEQTTVTWVPVLFLILYVLSSIVGILPIPWTTSAELFPLEIRGIGFSIVFAIGNILMFSAIQIYPTLKHILGGVFGVQCFFCIMSIVAFIYCYLFLPETHKKKLTEIEDYFKHHTIYIRRKKETNTIPTEKETELNLLGNV